MRLYLIRHCESENNALWAVQGSSDGRSEDPGLTAKGQKQAEVLGAYLAGAREGSSSPFAGGPMREGLVITHLYCSLMQRAVQTGTAVSKALDLPLIAWPEIHERGGIYLNNPQTDEEEGLPGPNRAFFEENYPHLVLPDSFAEMGWWNRPYEHHDAAVNRAAEVLDTLLARHGNTDDHVALVTHGGFTQSMLQILFNIAPAGSTFAGERFVWLKSNNGSITRIDITEDLLRLTYLNFIDYMPGDLIT
ncbi:MAG: histidine phosphatase family protein [Candidatus Promineifilaceae bacterium]|jgi:2,3-bisphosphoglycerate-dependent phosphoglycerate mutase